MQVILRVWMLCELFFKIIKPDAASPHLQVHYMPAFFLRAVLQEIKLSEKVGTDLIHMRHGRMQPFFENSFPFLCQGTDFANRQLGFRIDGC